MPAPTLQEAAALIARLEAVYGRPLTAREGVDLLTDNYEALTAKQAEDILACVCFDRFGKAAMVAAVSLRRVSTALRNLAAKEPA